VIAVFTKFDQFKRDVEMKLEDEDRYETLETNLVDEVERAFRKYYLGPLGGYPFFVCLESKFFYKSTNV